MPGLEGAPATKSNISFIDGNQGILAYRGYPIEVLAERSTFEKTALLLLDGNLPTRHNLKAFDREMRDNRRVKFRIRELMRQLPPNGHPMDMLQSMMACLGMYHSDQPYLASGEHCGDLDFVHNISVNIIAHMATLVAMWEHIRNGYDPIEPRSDLTHAYIDEQLKAKKKIRGFGHREYSVKYPRAVILERLMGKFTAYKESQVGPL